ncbi:MAG: carboxymuconolactone decarboxylase family protein [Phycisphaerales bacterium]
MAQFTQHTIESASEQSRPALQATKQAFGMIPNLQTFMAESPALINAYSQAWQTFHTQTDLNPVEQQVVLLTANFENNCEYCMSGHSFLAKSAGMDADALASLRDGTPIADPRLEALRSFTRGVVVNRGWVGDDAVESFLAAGFSKRNVLDVIAGVSLKVMSNYTNHVVHTPLDPFMEATKWAKPASANA